jgi:hypothetical protein
MVKIINKIIKIFNLKIVLLNNLSYEICNHCSERAPEYYAWGYLGDEYYLCKKCNDILTKQYVSYLNPVRKKAKKNAEILNLRRKK